MGRLVGATDSEQVSESEVGGNEVTEDLEDASGVFLNEVKEGSEVERSESSGVCVSGVNAGSGEHRSPGETASEGEA